ncbi:MAG: matrixin family metalloprotease [Acidobacteria bacterium]|nr:matrixin family metalloprotease [Acidobacteriota bacterium]
MPPEMTSHLSSVRRWLAVGSVAVLPLAVLLVHAQIETPLLRPLDADRPIPTFISQEGPGNRPGDRDLAERALEAWAKATGGILAFRFVEEKDALLRLRWVSAPNSLYGEMRPIMVEGRRGAEVFVRPEIAGLGKELDARARADSLFRDTIVYLTCLHEFGHALGLDHTANYEDIMFSFGYEGDILNYFQRYRRQLQKREDIALHLGLSELDLKRIRQLYPPPKIPARQ